MALLNEYRVELDGVDAVIIGRSDIVGKPIAHLLLQANATVTICHTHTRDLARATLEADVLVVAAGRPAFVSPDMFKIVVDGAPAGSVGFWERDWRDMAAACGPVKVTACIELLAGV